MPRPVEESRFRRFMMQIIMWVVLGLTIGAAGLLDRAKARKLAIVLDQRVRLDEFSIQLPRGWQPVQEMQAGDSRLVVQDSQTDDVLEIRTRRRSLPEMFGFSQVESRERIPVGDQLSPLTVNRDPQEQQAILHVVRTLPSGRLLSITLVTGEMDPRAISSEKELIKQVAASVRVE